MPGTETRQSAYRFGLFELDNRSGDLRKSGVRIKLQEQPRRVLLLLLEHPGEVLTREQIQKSLWPDDTFVDFDNAINSAVRRLRDVLSDNAENPRFIETVARRGYRFLAPVTYAELSATAVAAPPVVSVPIVPLAVAPAGKKRNRVLVAAIVVAFVLAALSLPKLVQTRSNGETANNRVVPLTSNRGMELQPSLSPDGMRIAYAWNGSGRDYSIYVKQIGAGDPVRLTRDVARDFSPTWSPDGRWIAWLRDFGPEGAVIVGPSSGGQHRELARISKPSPKSSICLSTASPHICGLNYWGSLLAWSQDGKYLFTSGNSTSGSALSIVRISVSTGELRQITSPPPGIEGDMGAEVSRDGRERAFVRVIGAKTGDLYVLPLSNEYLPDAQPRRVTFDGADLESPKWMPNGRELIFSSNRSGQRELWRVGASGSGKLLQLAGMGENASDLAISQNGTSLVYSRGTYFGSLWKMPIADGKGGVPVRVTATTARDKFSHTSPDGRRIAFQSGRSGVDEIWICDADGTNAVQLTNFGKGMSGSPRWSPDGKAVAFDSNVSGNWAVYSILADGGRPGRVTKIGPNAFIPSWSRNGRWIYFTSTHSGRPEVWKVRPDGSSETQVTTGGGGNAIESADGASLYFQRENHSGNELWKMPSAGGTATKVLDSVSGRLYTLTPKGIFFAQRDPDLELRYLNFANGSIKSIGRMGNFAHADVSWDERWALYPEPENTDSNLVLSENFH